MNSRYEQISNLMWKEVAAKSPAATFAFCLFGIMIFFYHFGDTPFVNLIRGGCVLILLANFFRYWISKKIDPQMIANKKDRNTLRISIILNAIGWSIIFTTAAIDKSHEPLHFGMMITIMSGFLTGSIVTLAYDKTIYFPFQVIILVPINLAFLYLYMTGKNSIGIYFFLFFTFYFFYQIRQYKDYRKQLIQRFNYQLDLELSYQDLQKNQEAFMKQTSKLIHTSKIASLGEMAGGLAHEINNSLMVILGSTQQIERYLSKDNLIDEKIAAKFSQNETSIMKIKSVIEGLKTFAQESEDSPKENIELKEILQRTMIYCQELLRAHQVELDLGEIPDVEINCRPIQIIQILHGLIKNADDAILKSGSEERWIKFSYRIRGRNIYISVSNNGPLIPKENSERLFQPFFTTKEVGRGTGLSLSISKGFANDHHGDLYLEPATEYTTFTLKLPIE